MESDISMIVPVEPGEAQLLIGLIETLFEDFPESTELADEANK